MKKRFFLMPIWIMFIIAVFSTVTMLLWNALVPTIFGLAVINFWQALGLLVLCKLLFGGFRGGRTFMHHWGGRHGRNPIHEKWTKMTPEEREEFIKRRGKFTRRFFDKHPHDHFGYECPYHTSNNSEKEEN